VAANLGALMARQARTVLVIDTDIERQSLSAVTHVRSTPGLVDVLTGGVEWAAAVRAVVVGRGRSMDVLPGGAFGARGVLDAAAPEFASLLAHVRRRYECVLLSSPLSRAGELSAAASGAGGVIVTVRAARTHHRVIGPLAALIRGRGLLLRGLVLWERADPSLVSA
jgi:MinD-like ATPase involved in chromosome partitioning or flagellar assembly